MRMEYIMPIATLMFLIVVVVNINKHNYVIIQKDMIYKIKCTNFIYPDYIFSHNYASRKEAEVGLAWFVEYDKNKKKKYLDWEEL